MTPQYAPARCLFCGANLDLAPTVYHALVTVCHYAPSTSKMEPRMVPAGQREVGR